MKFHRLFPVALAVLLAAIPGVVGAQGFSSVSSGKKLSEDPVPAEVQTPATAPAPAAEAKPSMTGPAPAEANSFMTGSAPAPAPAAAEANSFLTGSAAAAAAAAANPFLTGSAAAAVAAEPIPLVSTAPAVAAAPTGSGPATTVPFGSSSGAVNAPAIESADRVLVKKSERRLYLLRSDRVIADYSVKLGLSPTGAKQREGDFRTPEGVYEIAARNQHSDYFLSLKVSYPNQADRDRARELGTRPGGLVMIHGQPNTPRKRPDYYANSDWTDGCIAVSNSDMVDIWLRTAVGIPIEIRP
jgi:hypothetical protein